MDRDRPLATGIVRFVGSMLGCVTPVLIARDGPKWRQATKCHSAMAALAWRADRRRNSGLGAAGLRPQPLSCCRFERRSPVRSDGAVHDYRRADRARLEMAATPVAASSHRISLPLRRCD